MTEDQVVAAEQESARYGTLGTDVALLIDGLQSEREQELQLMWPIGILILEVFDLLPQTHLATNNLPEIWLLLRQTPMLHFCF